MGKIVKRRGAVLSLVGSALLIWCVSSPVGVAAGATKSASKSYTVVVVDDVTGTFGFTTPEVVPAVKGAFGHTPGVNIVTCDSQGTLSEAQVCAHEAVLDHAAAVIVGQSQLAYDQSILTQAGIPVLDDADSTSATSFSLSNGYGPPIGLGLYKAGCRRLGILYYSGQTADAQSIASGGKWKAVSEVDIPFASPDLTPAVAKLAEAKVQCVALSIEPQAVAQAMIAIKQDHLNAEAAGIGAVITKQVINSLGKKANGMIVIGEEANPGDKGTPVIARIQKDMRAAGSNLAVTTSAVLAWAAAKLILAAVPHIAGQVTAPSLLKALNGLRNVSTDGAIHSFSAIGLKNPADTRLFNHYVIDYTVENGALKPTSGFVDLTPVLDAK
jgi:hypothetical protein